MKFILKLLCAPIIFILWLVTAICNLILKLSSVVLMFAAILVAAAAVLKFIEGAITAGLIGLGVAFLLSPFGLPTLVMFLLAKLYCLQNWLKCVIVNDKTCVPR